MIRAVLLLTGLAVAAGPRLTLLLFLSTDCPISNRYAPEIQRLHARYGDRVSFQLVYPNPENTGAVDAHVKEFALPGAVVLDLDHRLVEKAGVKVTPEAALFDGERLVYRGRIDNRNIDLGKARPVPTVHDLEEAIRAGVEGRRVSRRTTRAVGCAIRR